MDLSLQVGTPHTACTARGELKQPGINLRSLTGNYYNALVFVLRAAFSLASNRHCMQSVSDVFEPNNDLRLSFNFISLSVSVRTARREKPGIHSKLFLPRDAMHKRGYSRHAVSVCPSVPPSIRLSVCHVRGSCQNE